MGKRKRNVTNGAINGGAAVNGDHQESTNDKKSKPEPKKVTLLVRDGGASTSTNIQIVVGTYEKILHGVTATFSEGPGELSGESVDFADTFLFNAHASAIRCLAISPPSSNTDATQSAKVILASGSSDQIINLYHISTSPPPAQKSQWVYEPSLTGHKVTANPKNRELGSLQHHNSGVNALEFPSRSKLLSAAEDNTVAVTRTRDWTVLSTIKVPIPKAHGRPSGDTAALGDTPAGVNDFAIHPSMKLIVSVGRGEKCMRLWNLVTGKKAGVLNFERDLLQGIGEGRWASGEGRKVEWDSLGEEFAIGFERGAVVFGMDSKPKCRIIPFPPSKIHQLHYMEMPTGNDSVPDKLAISTEDGRILFYSTDMSGETEKSAQEAEFTISNAKAIGQIGGNLDELRGRIKDFEILKLPAANGSTQNLLIITGSSDGSVRLWMLDPAQLTSGKPNLSRPPNGELHDPSNNKDLGKSLNPLSTPQVGRLLGTYETGNRITCLKAFIMSESQAAENIILKAEGTRSSGNGSELDSNDNTSS